jgi:hypothetical protein
LPRLARELVRLRLASFASLFLLDLDDMKNQQHWIAKQLLVVL